MKYTLLSVAALALVPAVANAGVIDVGLPGTITVTTDFVDPGDGSQRGTAEVANITPFGPDLFVETFDLDNGDCGFTQAANGLEVTGGSLQQGLTPGQAAPPADDTTCYLASPGIGEALPGSVNFNLDDILTSTDNVIINYVGLYWGSIDNFNTFEFFLDDELVFDIDGADVLSALGGDSGDQFDEGSNAFINLFFEGEAIQFNNFQLTSTSRAFEIDNLTIRVEAVPLPAPLAFLGLGLMGLGIARRRSAK